MKPFVHAALCVLLASAISAAAEDQREPYVAEVGADGVQRVHIIGGDYFFKPAHVIVKINMRVELSLGKEKGIVPHSFVIDAPDAGMAVDEELGADVKTVSFTPSTAGRFPFYCRNRLLFFKSHRDKGMKGILEVVE